MPLSETTVRQALAKWMRQRGQAKSCVLPGHSVYQAPVQYASTQRRDKEQNWPPKGELVEKRQVKMRDDLIDLAQDAQGAQGAPVTPAGQAS